MICLVLGAGASLANAEHFHRMRQVSSNPPLDTTFFEKIDSLGISIPKHLRSYGQRYPGIDPFDGRLASSARMEDFFKDLFYDFQDATPSSTDALAYSELVDVYVRVLRETTNWMAADNKTGGPVGKVIAAAAASDDEITVITFNHDLVIENEIEKRARLRQRWCLERSYGQVAQDLTFTTPSRPGSLFSMHSPDCDHSRPITVLKLHGSLNWYVRIAGKAPKSSLLSGAAAPPKLLCTRRRVISGRLRYTLPNKGRGRKSWYTWPVVVPPVQTKDPFIRSFFPAVWQDARDALSRADRVAFFGYSLPRLDIASEKMFQRSLSKNQSIEFLDVVDPAPASADRYAGLLGTLPIRWYPNAPAFLDLFE